ncbi:MAG: type IV pilus biogenesis/stability protein PilW [Pseudomonadota bacterium]
MSRITRLVRLSLLMLVAAVSGCATQGQISEGSDTTGDLGREKGESPATLYVKLGIAYLNEGQPAIALKKLKKGISLDPENAQAHNVMGILYEQLGEMELAGEYFARAVELQPQDPYIRNARGRYFCNQGQYDKAAEEFESALSNPLYHTPWVAMTNAGLCTERTGDRVVAEQYYRRALKKNDKFHVALYQMAKLTLNQKSYLSARAYLERYNEVAEATAGSLWLGVQIEQHLGDRGKALEYKAQLLDIFPDASEVQFLRQSNY